LLLNIGKKINKNIYDAGRLAHNTTAAILVVSYTVPTRSNSRLSLPRNRRSRSIISQSRTFMRTGLSGTFIGFF
jgi:hypothetical protein